MSKTLWHTIKLEVPKEMVNITKNDKVVVKKSLTKTNNISKANKEPSIKIIPGDTNKPKIISDGKEWNVEELKLKMKKAKDLGKKNEGKEYKKKADNEIFKNYRNKINNKINERKEETLQKVKKERKKKEIEEIIENKNLSLDYLKELARKVLKKKFTSANEGIIDMDRYSRETMQNLIKEFYNKRPTEMEYIIKTTDKEDPQQINQLVPNTKKEFKPITSFADFKKQLSAAVQKDRANINKIKRAHNKK